MLISEFVYAIKLYVLDATTMPDYCPNIKIMVLFLLEKMVMI